VFCSLPTGPPQYHLIFTFIKSLGDSSLEHASFLSLPLDKRQRADQRCLIPSWSDHPPTHREPPEQGFVSSQFKLAKASFSAQAKKE
jgi:hypothetical protein